MNLAKREWFDGWYTTLGIKVSVEALTTVPEVVERETVEGDGLRLDMVSTVGVSVVGFSWGFSGRPRWVSSSC